MENKILLFFGCWDNVGHYLHTKSGHTIYHGNANIPDLNKKLFEHIDATFPPPETNLNMYNDCVVPPVRIVAWWDRSIDKRPNSNSALVGYGYESAEEMIDDAYKIFPKQMNRQPRPVPYHPKTQTTQPKEDARP